MADQPDSPMAMPRPAALVAAPQLADVVMARWPALLERLGERRNTFVEAARQQCARHGLGEDTPPAARFLNLCCCLGPAFEQRTENEWALAILSDERLTPAVRIHQLVFRARIELRRRGEDEEALARADAALLDTLDELARAEDGDAEPLPRVACDIEAIELKVLENDFRREYQFTDGQWSRVAAAQGLPPVRIGAQWPAPSVVSVLTRPAAEGPGARLQARQAIHGGCAGDRHPALRWLDARGLTRYAGHEARAASWPVAAPLRPPPATGLGIALAEELAPDVCLLQVPSCGLRDEGLPLGAQSFQVWTYPATQWLCALDRDGASTLRLPAAGTPTPPAPTRCRIERDGEPIDATPWVRGFDVGLTEAVAAGLTKLFEAWQASAQQASLEATPSLLNGRQVLSWGWREGAGGLAGEAVLRVVAELDLGLSLNLQLDGQLEVGGTRGAVQLTINGEARHRHSIQREHAQPPLAAAVADAVLRFAFPFALHVDPVASDNGALCHVAGPCVGSLGGELGLRPRLSGGSGWQWYLRLACDPVLAPFVVVDPVLGQTRRTLALLPAQTLVDWSLG